MNAIELLRSMHADTKVQFKTILAADDPATADRDWQALQPVLKLHEKLEDEFVYGPLQNELGPGTPLGDWVLRHDADVDFVDQLILQSLQLAPSTPAWRMCIARVMDALSKHVTDEEGQIFGRVEQIWDADKLERIGAQMQTLVNKSTQTPTTPKSKRARQK